MNKTVIVKVLVTFLSGGLVAIAGAGLIPVSPEVMNAICTQLGLVIGGAFVNARK